MSSSTSSSDPARARPDASAVARRRPIAKIDPAAKFDSLGLDSAESVFLASALEDWIGVPLHAEAAMDHPNIAALSRFVHETIAANQGPATGR